MADYGFHPDKDLNSVFNGYQGVKPEDATIIIMALDANYDENFGDDIFFKNDIIDYQKNYQDWIDKNSEIHHPFLGKNYIGDKRKGGVKYHSNFSKLELSLEMRKSLCFLELLGRPTVGRTGGNYSLILSDDNLEHLKRINNILCTQSNKMIFIPKGMIKLLSTIGKKKNLQGFKDLSNILSSNNKAIYNGNHFMTHTHFSGSKNPNAKIEKDIPIIKAELESKGRKFIEKIKNELL